MEDNQNIEKGSYDFASMIDAEIKRDNVVNEPISRKTKKQKKLSLAKRQKMQIMADPDKRKKSVKMGVIGIIVCLLSIALVYPVMIAAAYLVVYAFTHWLYLIGNLVLFVIGIGLPIMYIYFQVFQFSFSIAQISIRRDWFGWFCIIFSVLTVVAIMFLTAVLILPALSVVVPV